MYSELRQQLGGGELVELPPGGMMRLQVMKCIEHPLHGHQLRSPCIAALAHCMGPTADAQRTSLPVADAVQSAGSFLPCGRRHRLGSVKCLVVMHDAGCCFNFTAHGCRLRSA